MSIERAEFDRITEQDLQELVEAQVPEGLRLDFKLTCYGKSDSDKRELLKDASALANSHGGHLIIGIEEIEGVATNVVGVDTDADAEILRMEQILRNAIEPPISGIRMRSIPLTNGRKVLLLRIPRSWRPPHRVTAQSINKFYARHSAGVHEPSIEELRALFDQSSSALERARQFRNDRLDLIDKGYGDRPLASNGRLFIHIIPIAAFSGFLNLDVEAIHEQEKKFHPLDALQRSPRFNFHGFINERGGDQNCGYTQVFRNGIVEATKANIIKRDHKHSIIKAPTLEKCIFQQLPIYLDALKDMRVPPPLTIMITLKDTKGAYYIVKQYTRFDEVPTLPDDTLFLPECVLEDYGSTLDYHKAIRPAFDALWNAIGYAKAGFFNEEGLWNEPLPASS
ncbi:putative DNA-binding protein [Plasticicumulans lactativorans]|uniref:Putative DNA-binding protein n=1 Tax=Plasticicumulans lactativorans TaxID=1133106 RepID=A0A4R2LIR6_9GAMM|nr:ATP-binding protein [Plasticicumulans lactativorans]TCO79235.1 putative DNA-binding protein [Plasticicumulans lactativorans]